MTIGCPDCGALQDLPALGARTIATCSLCEGDLEKTAGRSLTAGFACSLATFLLLGPTNLLPLISVSMFGLGTYNRIFGGIAALWDNRWLLLSGISALLVIVLPFARFGLLSLVLGSLRINHRPAWLGPAFRWAIGLDPWAMPDVFLLASFVGYYRLAQLQAAQVTIETGGKCFIAAAILTMLSRAVIDQRTVWRAIGPEYRPEANEPTLACTTCDLVQPVSRRGWNCPRCGALLHIRKPHAIGWTTALLITSFVLFFPANIYPMNISDRFGERHAYTIFTGIRELFEHGPWVLGVIIFFTSILVPLLKILVIAWCVFTVRHPSRKHLIARTKLFRLVSELGRWSKTDPFTIVFFVPLVKFGGIVTAGAGWGATAFLMMTMVQMFAALTFDPRLMWDAALARADEDTGP